MPGPLPLLANPAELATLTGMSAADSQLLSALREASRRFRGAVRHQVTLAEADVQELDGRQRAQLRLPAPLPIVSVSQITIDGEVVPATNYRVNKRNGIVTARDSYWPRPPAAIEVTYTHGYAPSVPDGTDADWPVDGPLLGLPESIQSAVLEMAQIVLNTTPGVQSRTVLGDSITFGGSAVGATQSWADVVAEFRERTGDES